MNRTQPGMCSSSNSTVLVWHSKLHTVLSRPTPKCFPPKFKRGRAAMASARVLHWSFNFSVKGVELVSRAA